MQELTRLVFRQFVRRAHSVQGDQPLSCLAYAFVIVRQAVHLASCTTGGIVRNTLKCVLQLYSVHLCFYPLAALGWKTRTAAEKTHTNARVLSLSGFRRWYLGVMTENGSAGSVQRVWDMYATPSSGFTALVEGGCASRSTMNPTNLLSLLERQMNR